MPLKLRMTWWNFQKNKRVNFMKNSLSDLLQPQSVFSYFQFQYLELHCNIRDSQLCFIAIQNFISPRTSSENPSAGALRQKSNIVQLGPFQSRLDSQYVNNVQTWVNKCSLDMSRQSDYIHVSPFHPRLPLPPSFRKSLKKTFVRQVSGDRKLYTSRKIMLDHKKYASLVKR